MHLIDFNELPESMQNEEVRKYYEILKNKKGTLIFKRCFDIFCSLVAIILLSPIMAILAFAIKMDSDGPVFYRQERVTTNGKIFRIFKFRTMVQNADKMGSLVTVGDDNRITKVGKFIRKFRLDEIPQLLNIISGDMSFVGTRPEVKKYVEEYSDEMKATLLMPAGVTSNACIKYKNEDEILKTSVENMKSEMQLKVVNGAATTVLDTQKIIDEAYVEDVLPEKMKYNLEYIENFNIFSDIKICINTVIGVLK